MLRVIFLLMMVTFSFNVNATANCSTSGTSNAPIPATDFHGGSCMSTPEQYSVSIYEIGLCRNITSLDGTTDPLSVVNNNCSKVFSNNSSVAVTISSDLSTQKLTNGTFHNPPVGTHTYAYVKMVNLVKSKAYKYFQLVSQGNSLISTDGSGTYTPSSNPSVGVCWTVNSTYNKSRNTGSVADTKCGAAVDGTYDFASATLDYLNYNGSYPYFTNSGSAVQTSNASAYLTIGGHYYTTDQGATPADQAILFFPLSSNLEINDIEIPNISILFEITNAIKISPGTQTQWDGSGNPINLSPNYKINSFNVHMTATSSRH